MMTKIDVNHFQCGYSVEGYGYIKRNICVNKCFTFASIIKCKYNLNKYNKIKNIARNIKNNIENEVIYNYE